MVSEIEQDTIDGPSAGTQLAFPPLDPRLPPWPSRHEEIGGVRLHVRRTNPEWSDTEAGTAVYIHGLGGSSTNWTDLGAQLAPWSRGVAVDLPGFGFSEPAADFDFRMSSYARVMADVIADLGDGPVHLFGNSMGGAIAILTAARAPELVRTLTLISPAVPDLRLDPRRLSDPRMAVALVPMIGRPARRQLAALGPTHRARQVINLCFADPSRFPPHRLAELAEEHGARMDLPWATPSMARATASIVRDWFSPGARSLWSALEKVPAPTLVAWGTEDRVISVRKARRTEQRLRRGRLLMLRNTGHVAQMEHPTAVARAVADMWQAVSADQW